MAFDGPRSIPLLERIDKSKHVFLEPSKKIHEGGDVQAFLTSKAYRDIMTFLLQLNRAMFPRRKDNDSTLTWPLQSLDVEFSEPVRRLQLLLSKLVGFIDEVPPDSGPRRFGNISFRRWYQIVTDRAPELLDEAISSEVLYTGDSASDTPTARTELTAYFLGSFGSSQRLDYGTGHELSFLAFLGCIWKLNGFPQADAGVEERGIVLGVIEPYLELVRRLITTYTLEPAGSHGVWGLDDHSFIPYILGSAQYSPAIAESDDTPVEGSLPDAPSPNSVVKALVVERERKTNIYFSAIGFIYDVKKGPFWEHSPLLFDISGIKAGWGKINKGMIKMYNAEVLSKFPVVQHFPMGSLFSWDQDPNAVAPAPTAHSISQPQQPNTSVTPSPEARSVGTRAPWANTPQPNTALPGPTAAPWATARNPNPNPASATQLPVRTSLPDTSRNPPGPMTPTRAPWAQPQSNDSSAATQPTRAPWANPP
ncbi:phosphotyrosyl phosphatase activator [Talaromyces proteolyticus]|uniref:Serine/threonine-protein phosphatase 2A activator n=1 Tax=Talaromyces proteolyticus TaxID=1131652 RepID=A0AAD4PTZ2_9EURO|nr:phosphotyrosyl phosphatase activator [Talaromyces proteolyticus]KAH8689491.1 phosphotyrosyl phosphatase activator [Talaromyces proteolyticus]